MLMVLLLAEELLLPVLLVQLIPLEWARVQPQIEISME